ncbi:general transcription factor II-I repeat domain-containing protein 2 [Trichonephila clavipes]|nr:general transcription factor II-I repeat domain-containing protein 2 [Trichonephila clavipes]
MQSEYVICEEHKNGCQSKAAIIVECLRLEIWYSEIVTMTSRPHLTEELRWQAIGRLEAGQSQIKVARWQKVCSEYAHQIKLLEFDRIFSDFKSCELQFRLFASPLSIDIELVDENLQMESIEIQCDSLLKQKCMEVGIPDFYTFTSRSIS